MGGKRLLDLKEGSPYQRTVLGARIKGAGRADELVGDANVWPVGVDVKRMRRRGTGGTVLAESERPIMGWSRKRPRVR